MNLREAVSEILKSTLPNSINGIHIKYDLREVSSLTYYDEKEYVVTLMPVEADCENVALSLRICPCYFPSDLRKASVAYEYLQKQVEKMLMTFIRNINRRE